MKTLIILLSLNVIPMTGLGQSLSSHWKAVPIDSPFYQFQAFDSSNLIYFSWNPDQGYYSSNRGAKWNAIAANSSMKFLLKLDIIGTVALAVSHADSADYTSSDKGRTWARHPWEPIPKFLTSHPIVKRWYGVGLGWYEVVKEIPTPFPPPSGAYYYLRQDEPFGPLKLIASPSYDFLNQRQFDAADSAIYAYTGNGISYVEGEKKEKSDSFTGHIFQYIGEKVWLTSDVAFKSIIIFPNSPVSKPLITPIEFPLKKVYSRDSVVIASFQDRENSPFYAGAYLSKNLGKSWSELPILDGNIRDRYVPVFWILDSLRMFMAYRGRLYYTSDGGGPSIPLASVATARDAQPGVAVFGSVLTVSGGGEIEVLDLLGRRIVRAERSVSGEPVKINLLPYPDGIYFVRSGKEITKILWQRE